MNLFVMRHGLTVWNEKGIIQGRSNNRLSKTGKEMVEDIAKKYSKTPFDVIVCSPLFRTVQTANIMNKYHNVKIIRDCEIIEIDQGIFSGKKRAFLSEKERKLQQMRLKENGQETFEEIDGRIKNFVDNIKTKYPFENVLVVTHDICAVVMEHFLCNKPFGGIEFANAEIKKFVI